MKRTLLTVMLLTGPCAQAQQTHYWGYSTMQYTRTSGETLNTGSKHHGVAIRLSAEKATALKGARIVGIRTAFSTSLLESLHFFVSHAPGSEALAQSDGAKASLSLKDYTLNTPVEIDGSELYVGYEAVCKDDLRKPVLFDHASALPAGTIYAYTDAGWTDASASGYGAPVLQLVLENLPSSYSSDILLKSIGNQAYNLQQGTYSIQGELFNCGTTTLQSADVVTRVGNGQPFTTHVEGLDIAPNTSATISANGQLADAEGNLPLSFSISQLNGSPDADASDNTLATRLWVQQPEKKLGILVEKFTGQGCQYCPYGDEAIERQRALHPELIPVAHHTYLRGDVFTMNESSTLSYFYNVSAFPSFLVNRLPFTADSPLAGGVEGLEPDLAKAIAHAQEQPVNVGISLDNRFDSATHQGQLLVNVHTFATPSEEAHALNVWLTQDSLHAVQMDHSGVYQKGYSHNHTLRGQLIGSDAWGQSIPLHEGETITRVIDYNVPDSITSTFTGYNWLTEPKNMQIVAFVSDVSKNKLATTVHNAISIPLTSSSDVSGIEGPTLSADNGSAWQPDDAVEVYDLTGRLLRRTVYAHWSQSLPAGTYILRSAHGTKAMIKSRR